MISGASHALAGSCDWTAPRGTAPDRRSSTPSRVRRCSNHPTPPCVQDRAFRRRTRTPRGRGWHQNRSGRALRSSGPCRNSSLGSQAEEAAVGAEGLEVGLGMGFINQRRWSRPHPPMPGLHLVQSCRRSRSLRHRSTTSTKTTVTALFLVAASANTAEGSFSSRGSSV